MTEFDFLSVLVSIIFGLALTHLLSGQFRFIYQRRMTETHLLYTGWVFMALVLNWWMLFTWHDYQGWTFDAFLLIVLWALSFYVAAIALYPPEEIAPEGKPFNYFWFFCAVIGTIAADIAWTAMRGSAVHIPGTTCLSRCTTQCWPSSPKGSSHPGSAASWHGGSCCRSSHGRLESGASCSPQGAGAPAQCICWCVKYTTATPSPMKSTCSSPARRSTRRCSPGIRSATET